MCFPRQLIVFMINHIYFVLLSFFHFGSYILFNEFFFVPCMFRLYIPRKIWLVRETKARFILTDFNMLAIYKGYQCDIFSFKKENFVFTCQPS